MQTSLLLPVYDKITAITSCDFTWGPSGCYFYIRVNFIGTKSSTSISVVSARSLSSNSAIRSVMDIWLLYFDTTCKSFVTSFMSGEFSSSFLDLNLFSAWIMNFFLIGYVIELEFCNSNGSFISKSFKEDSAPYMAFLSTIL